MKKTPLSLVLLALMLLTSCGVTDPAAGVANTDSDTPGLSAPAGADSLTIDGARMLADVEFLASDALQGRAAGSQGAAMARGRIQAAFEEAGLSDIQLQPFAFDGGKEGVNVVGVVHGTDPDAGYFAITAHYDHLGVRSGQIFNGADDNASGTAALMEFARQVASNPLRHTVLFAALDAEESGLRGARALVDSPPVALDRVELNINMDMVSRSTAGELYVSGTYHYPELKPLVDHLTESLPVKLLFGHDLPGTGSDDWTNSSDHGPFHQAGIPFLYFGVEDHPGYHQPSDIFQDITPEFYIGAAESIFRVIRVLDGSLTGRVRGRDG